MSELLDRVKSVARSRPEAVALRHGRARLTYAELDARACALAGKMRELGVTNEAAVAVCYPRSFEQIIAALAVMLAGGAYVPLDPAWPRERMRSIVRDAGAKVLVAAGEVEDLGAVQVEVGEAAGSFVCGCVRPGAEALAYILYTSGTTGTPKGVEITHGNLDHLIAWHTEAFGVTEQDRASHVAGLGFDASVWEVWPYLMAGACVSLVDDVVRTSPTMLRDWMVDEAITVGFVPTALAEPMIAMDWPRETKMRFLLTGGDRLHHGPRSGLPFKVANNYGPTECTVVATSGVVTEEAGMPTIGKAIAGTQVYVLDEDGRDAESGEIWIGGAGVGRGYRGMAEQTARCFVESAHGRLYRTGDYGCMLADGQIAFRGRMDGQVKIRGQRMELDEIVCLLGRHPDVAFGTVAARGEGEEKRLVAYVLAADGQSPSVGELREHLRRSLPEAMIPSVFVRLTSMPLNGNGKVDAGALPEPDETNMLREREQSEAASVVEETVLGIVRTLLKTDAVASEDNFFLVGGHSLMGTRLVMRIREAFGVRFTLRDLFEAKTVAALAKHIEALVMAEIDAMSEEEAASRVML